MGKEAGENPGTGAASGTGVANASAQAFLLENGQLV